MGRSASRFSAAIFAVPSSPSDGAMAYAANNQIDPALFSACFTDWVRACWPDRPELGGPILTAKVGVEGSNPFARSSSLPLISGN